jgi:hypothetical protein
MIPVIPVTLTICTSKALSVPDARDLSLVEMAFEELNKKFRKKDIQTLSLTGNRPFRELDLIAQCHPTDIRPNKIVIGLWCETSYYVGQAVIKLDLGEVAIRIEPDLKDEVRNYLLEYACGVYLPRNLATKKRDQHNGSNWLLLLMWRCAFERALRASSIPKAYIQKHDNLRYFKGCLSIAKHIQENLTDQSRLYCNYRQLSVNITINQVIRYVYKLVLNAKGIDKKAFVSLAEHDERLAAFGVTNKPILPEAIDRIKYTRMTEVYRPLMMISKSLIRHLGAADCKYSLDSLSYFVDWTEVWENYLLKLMQRNIQEYSFFSPNEAAEPTYLLKCGREIRPDFLVYKDGELVAVMDAKYKKYNTIGSSSDEKNGAIQREDLYQMMTYLYHYSIPGKSLKGIFLSRGAESPEFSSPLRNTSLAGEIALLNLPLTDNSTLEDIKKQEATFCQRLRDYLDRSVAQAKR